MSGKYYYDREKRMGNWHVDYEIKREAQSLAKIGASLKKFICIIWTGCYRGYMLIYHDASRYSIVWKQKLYLAPLPSDTTLFHFSQTSRQ